MCRDWWLKAQQLCRREVSNFQSSNHPLDKEPPASEARSEQEDRVVSIKGVVSKGSIKGVFSCPCGGLGQGYTWPVKPFETVMVIHTHTQWSANTKHHSQTNAFCFTNKKCTYQTNTSCFRNKYSMFYTYKETFLQLQKNILQVQTKIFQVQTKIFIVLAALNWLNSATCCCLEWITGHLFERCAWIWRHLCVDQHGGKLVPKVTWQYSALVELFFVLERF